MGEVGTSHHAFIPGRRTAVLIPTGIAETHGDIETTPNKRARSCHLSADYCTPTARRMSANRLLGVKPQCCLFTVACGICSTTATITKSGNSWKMPNAPYRVCVAAIRIPCNYDLRANVNVRSCYNLAPRGKLRMAGVSSIVAQLKEDSIE